MSDKKTTPAPTVAPTPAPTVAPTPVPELEKELSLLLNVAETNIVLGALDEIPHKISRKVIDKLIQQAEAQLKKPE
jgi:hypothetical protein